MANSFPDKLIELYFDHCHNNGTSRFRAFCILLHGIKFVAAKDFRNSILRFVSKRYRDDFESLLLGRRVRTITHDYYELDYEDLDFIFISLLYLKSRISVVLMNDICGQLEIVEHETYLRGLFYSFFDIIKKGTMKVVAKMPLHEQLLYFRKNSVTVRNNPKVLSKEKFGPQITTNLDWWGEKAPYKITNIPMGGQNKKY